VAAAEYLAVVGKQDRALETLIDSLKHPSPDVRLRAINVLDRMGEAARTAAKAMRTAGMNGPQPAEYLNRMVKYVPAKFEQ
jgi:HEAT repeat protein